MKKAILLLFFTFYFLLFTLPYVQAQCSICSRTASQMGEKPSKGLNVGILYLAFVPYAVVGVIAYRWFKSNKA